MFQLTLLFCKNVSIVFSVLSRDFNKTNKKITKNII